VDVTALFPKEQSHKIAASYDYQWEGAEVSMGRNFQVVFSFALLHNGNIEAVFLRSAKL